MTASDWIPITERLPEDGSLVLIGGTGGQGWFLADCLFKGGRWLLFDPSTGAFGEFECRHPSHWMPHPPPPEDDEFLNAWRKEQESLEDA